MTIVDPVPLQPGMIGIVICTQYGTIHCRKSEDRPELRRLYRQERELSGWDSLTIYDLGTQRGAVDFACACAVALAAIDD